MSGRPTTLERAFELARSGECGGVQDIRRRMKAEGYTSVGDQLYGKSLYAQLKSLCDAAKAANPSAEQPQQSGGEA
jgi:hypothetical protein